MYNDTGLLYICTHDANTRVFPAAQVHTVLNNFLISVKVPAFSAES